MKSIKNPINTLGNLNMREEEKNKRNTKKIPRKYPSCEGL
jgi:hypothetical protein